MQNFTSNIKSITADTLFTGFKSVIRDNAQSAYVAAGKIGSVELPKGVSVIVYEGKGGIYVAQAAVMVRGMTRVVASAEFDHYDM